MQLRTLVLHLDDSRACEVRARLAMRLAVEHGAHLVGLSPTGWLDVAWQLGPDLVRSTRYHELSIDVLRSRARDIVGAFEHQALQTPRLDWASQQPEGDVVHELVEAGRRSDLVVVGRPGGHTPLVPPDLPQQVLLRCGRPVLVVPHDSIATAVDRRIVVAWKDSREATRAIADAMPLLARAESVELVWFDDGGQAGSATTAALDETRRWLARHGVATPPAVRGDAGRGDVGDALIAHAQANRADLIVAGGYGHSRLSEFVLGGVTRTLLERSPIPVLLSH